MTDPLTTYLRRKQEFEEAKSSVVRLEGMLASLLESLEKEYEVPTKSKAALLLIKEEETLQVLKKQLAKAIDKFDQEEGKRLGNNNI